MILIKLTTPIFEGHRYLESIENNDWWQFLKKNCREMSINTLTHHSTLEMGYDIYFDISKTNETFFALKYSDSVDYSIVKSYNNYKL